MPRSATLKDYYLLIKPGIIRGNLVIAIAGFILGSKDGFDFRLFLYLVAGISLVIASACVFNNVIDRNIDKQMERTKKRALASGSIPAINALTYGTALGLGGFTTLYLQTNLLTTLLGLLAFIDYVIFYGITKRRSVHGTLVGSISGAIPPVAGYTAATNRFDLGALLLFLIMVLWQMAHFYAIAMYRIKDYTAAKIPVLPIKRGMITTKKYILAYVAIFTLIAPLLGLFGYAGALYIVGSAALGLYWLWTGLFGIKTKDEELWARKMFLVSLIVILGMSILISADSILI